MSEKKSKKSDKKSKGGSKMKSVKRVVINENHFKFVPVDITDPFVCYECGCLNLKRVPSEDDSFYYNDLKRTRIQFICPECERRGNGNRGFGDWYCSVLSMKYFSGYDDELYKKAKELLDSGNYQSLYTIEDEVRRREGL